VFIPTLVTQPLANLGPDEFYRLYVEEGRTETEIAVLYGTYQVRINRLRKQFGILTISKSDRLKLPGKLEPRLRSILVGSMLGDGRLFKTGSKTAAYTEHHSVKQRPYLDWKVQEWATFWLSTRDVVHHGFPGNVLTTHGCSVLFPFWQTFYPTGLGDKVFTGMPLEWVDDLALAVWFMDDGSKGQNGVRFAVSPDPANQQVLMRALRHLGIQANLYTTGDAEICIHSRTSLNRFLKRVEPHMHSSMLYKLDFHRPKAGIPPRDLLTTERLQPLLDRSFSAQAIAELLQVSRNSVRRALDRMGVPRNTPGRPKKVVRQELDDGSALEAIRRLDATSPTYEDSVLGILLKTEIPLRLPSQDEALLDWCRLMKSPAHYQDGQFSGISSAGARLCQHLFAYRWDARYREHLSAREAWYDPTSLRKAVRFQLRVKDPMTPVRIFRAVQAVVRAPTNFRPCFAKAVVSSLCPEGGLVLDPCAGYGGRATGTLASGRPYVGCDPHPDAGMAYEQLGRLLGLSEPRFTFHGQPFEDVDLGQLQADLVFTSPPYFSVERYSEDSRQSWVRYRSWNDWLEGFLEPLIRKSWTHLRPGCVMAINTKNVRIGRQAYPIAQELQTRAQRVGFQLEDTWNIPLGFLGKMRSTEPLFVFRKPSVE